jgi:tRNA dimethylallyltransferase
MGMTVARRKVDGGRRLRKIVCVVGPTSSGKTALGIRLAKQFHGEIINADSRQIFKNISIGTGKPEGTRKSQNGHRGFFVKNVPHYLMDFLEPTKMFTVVEWRERAERAIRGIGTRHHLPIVVGGTGLYVSALIDNFNFPKVEPKTQLREAYQEKSLSELVAMLLRLDPEAGQTVDLKNPRRVIRALEVSTFTGKPFSQQKLTGKPKFDAFQVGIQWPREKLYERIEEEIDNMIDRGWVEEIRRAIAAGLPENAPAMSSIGYRELISYLKGARTLDDAIKACKTSVRRYAKRQETWFKRDKRIHWVKDEEEAVKLVEAWINA